MLKTDNFLFSLRGRCVLPDFVGRENPPKIESADVPLDTLMLTPWSQNADIDSSSQSQGSEQNHVQYVEYDILVILYEALTPDQF